jgi:hypothetical protein
MTSPRKMTEPELRAAVLERCADRDLWVVTIEPAKFNQRDADNKGFPDLLIYGPAGALHRELKTIAGNMPGRGLSAQQSTWKHRLKAGGHDWDIWTPADLASGRIDTELDELEEPDEYTDRFSLTMTQEPDSSG